MGHTVLTQERAKLITDYLTADGTRAKEVLSLSSEEALPKINGGLGQNFTLDELNEYGKVLQKATKQIGLSDITLEGIAGGTNNEDVLTMAAATIIAASITAVGALGSAAIIKWG